MCCVERERAKTIEPSAPVCVDNPQVCNG